MFHLSLKTYFHSPFYRSQRNVANWVPFSLDYLEVWQSIRVISISVHMLLIQLMPFSCQVRTQINSISLTCPALAFMLHIHWIATSNWELQELVHCFLCHTTQSSLPVLISSFLIFPRTKEIY